MIKIDIYDLLCLCDKLAHETDEQAETIDELQCKLNAAVNANKSFIKRMAKQAREINALYKELEQQKTEINRLKMVIELNDDARVELVKENKNLRRNIEYLCNENVRLRHELNEVQNNDSNY